MQEWVRDTLINESRRRPTQLSAVTCRVSIIYTSVYIKTYENKHILTYPGYRTSVCIKCHHNEVG